MLSSCYSHVCIPGRTHLMYHHCWQLRSKMVMKIPPHVVLPADTVTHHIIKTGAALYLVIQLQHVPIESSDDEFFNMLISDDHRLISTAVMISSSWIATSSVFLVVRANFKIQKTWRGNFVDKTSLHTTQARITGHHDNFPTSTDWR